MTWFRAGGGNGVPAALKSEMNDVLNKKFGTSTDYPPNDWPDTVDLMGPLEEKTVSGPIASFPDGADDVPIKSLVASLPASLTPYEGVQIKHAGKNILPNTAQTATENGITFSVNSDGSVSLSGTCNADTNFYIYSGFTFPKIGQYFFSGCPSGGSTATYRVFLTNYGADVGSGYLLNVSNLSTTTSIRINIKSGVVTDGLVFKPQIEAGSAASAFEPYEAPTTYEIEIPNPNPNLFDKTAEHERATWNTDGSLNTDNYDHFAYRIAVEEKTAYTIAGEWFDRMIVFFDSNDNFISYVQPTMTDGKMKVTTPAGAAVMGVSIDFLATLFDNSITKDFNVYGGSVDVVAGEGVDDKVTYTLDENDSWAVYSGASHSFWHNVATGDVRPIDQTKASESICNHATFSSVSPASAPDWTFTIQGGQRIVVTADSTIDTVDKFQTWLENNTLQFVCPSSSPETFTFAHVPIDSKLGNNTMWSEQGDTEVTYRSMGTAYIYPEGEGVSF